jgi:polar amino acid transport system substrate-binding protein
MAAFVRLLENRSVDVQPLVSHVFGIEQAEEAYDLVTGKCVEPSLAILLQYPDSAEIRPPRAEPLELHRHSPAAPAIGFIGAGSFAQKFLIPCAGRGGELVSVVTAHGVTAKSVGEKFSFRSYSTDADDILSDPAINAVFIATRHDTHAALTAAAIDSGKNVFVEKPLALCEDELDRIVAVAQRRCDCRLMVGYNRRFSPLAGEAREVFRRVSGPLLINYRINAGFLPKDHWTQTEQGGGRILGEVCHFVDLMQWLTNSEPVLVHALSVAGDNAEMPDRDNVIVSLRFRNGSVGQIAYLACGDKLLAKERIEIFGGGQSFIIDDFRVGEHYQGGRRRTLKRPGKGHREEVEAFLRAMREGLPAPIPLASLALTSRATFAILDSLYTGLAQRLPLVELPD